jgi:hypothetical protein
MSNLILDEIEEYAELLGNPRGTVRFERKVRALKVDHCRDAKSLDSCSDCSYFYDCPVLRQFRQDQVDTLRERIEFERADEQYIPELDDIPKAKQ